MQFRYEVVTYKVINQYFNEVISIGSAIFAQIMFKCLFFKARLSRRQLPRITQDGLVEYSLQIPASAIRQYGNGTRNSGDKSRVGSSSDHSPRQPVRKYGADIDWILSGRTDNIDTYQRLLIFELFDAYIQLVPLCFISCQYQNLEQHLTFV